jgi:N-methylhydantoinase A
LRQVLLVPDTPPAEVPVLDRAGLPETFAGPLIIESYDSTVVVAAGWRGRIDRAGNLLLEWA